MKCCAWITVGLIAVGEILLTFTPGYEPPPALFMGLLSTFPFLVLAAAAAVFERLLQRAVDLQSENDLTV
jgi:hypothetical protein